MNLEISSREFPEVFNCPSVVCYRSLLGGSIRAEALGVFSGFSWYAHNDGVFGAAFTDSFKSRTVNYPAPISIVLGTTARAKIGFSVIQWITIFVVNCVRSITSYCAVQGNSKRFDLTYAKTASSSKFFSALTPRSMPAVLFDSISVPRVNQGMLTFSQRNISDTWADRNYYFSRILRGHRFSPVRFASWALEALTMTMPSLYSSPLEVCHR